jgi:transposase
MVVVVRSEQAKKREQHSLDKRMKTASTEALKSFNKLSRLRFACETDAEKALAIWVKSHKDIVSLSEQAIIKHAVFTKSGRPKLNQQPDSYDYQISGVLSSPLVIRAKQLQEKGLFVLATNDVSSTLTMEKMLSLYKSQQSVEKGFRFLKSPDVFNVILVFEKARKN